MFPTVEELLIVLRHQSRVPTGISSIGHKWRIERGENSNFRECEGIAALVILSVNADDGTANGDSQAPRLQTGSDTEHCLG